MATTPGNEKADPEEVKWYLRKLDDLYYRQRILESEYRKLRDAMIMCGIVAFAVIVFLGIRYQS